MTLDEIIGGDVGTGGAPSLPLDDDYGPWTPQQLAEVVSKRRMLSPAEQKVADEWRRQQAKKSKPSAPKAKTLGLTPKAPEPKSPSFFAKNVPGVNRPLWQVALAGLGVTAIGVGSYVLLSGKRK